MGYQIFFFINIIIYNLELSSLVGWGTWKLAITSSRINYYRERERRNQKYLLSLSKWLYS